MICEHFAANTSLLCLPIGNNATQAVELRGPDICSPVPEARVRLCDPNGTPLPTSNDDTAAMSEVSSILTAACEAHRLPLAQAWVRCKRCNTNSLTAAGAPFHLAGDEGVRGFREACVQQHLREGRGGLVQEAAMARGGPRFCADVTKYSMDEYPLAHHARFSGLAGCLAVWAELRRDTGEACVLEFFLPADCRDNAAAEAVAATIRARFGNGDLMAVALRGSQEWALEVLADDDEWPDHAIVADTPELGLDDHGGYERDSDEEDGVHLEAAVGEADAEAPGMNNGEREQGEDPERRASGRRREKKKAGKRKNEKTVSLEELQRYFSGRMRDAARSLGGKTIWCQQQLYMHSSLMTAAVTKHDSSVKWRVR
jgi:hypothetical protein